MVRLIAAELPTAQVTTTPRFLFVAFTRPNLTPHLAKSLEHVLDRERDRERRAGRHGLPPLFVVELGPLLAVDPEVVRVLALHAHWAAAHVNLASAHPGAELAWLAAVERELDRIGRWERG